MDSNKVLLVGCLSTFMFVWSCAGLEVAQDVQQGRNALHTGQPANAVSYLRRAAEIDPNYHAPDALGEGVLTYLGRAYYEMGNVSEARNVLEKAVGNRAQDHTARLYLGLTYLRNGNQDRGGREVETGLKGIYATLESIAASPYRGVYWDPGRRIRSEIQRALVGKLGTAELVRVSEWVGSKLDEEVDIARREEVYDRYQRGDN